MNIVMRPNDAFLGMMEQIDRPFYFGMGGIGDYLILLTMFYDECEKDEFDILFVANDIKPIKNLSFKFSKIHKHWIFPRKSFEFHRTAWSEIILNPFCKGTGVTPRDFQYVEDWKRCGKTNVFDYYKVKKDVNWAYQFKIPDLVVVQPYGGKDDPTKRKFISISELTDICEMHKYNSIMFACTDNEVNELRKRGFSKPIRHYANILDSYDVIVRCSHFIGTDSWGKTLARLAKCPNIIVYRNKFIDATRKQLFGEDYDPGDNVFLKDWDYNILEDPYED